MRTEESVFGIERRIEAVEALHVNPRCCFMNRKPNQSSCINNRKKLCSVLMRSINGCKSCKHLNKFRLLLCKVKTGEADEGTVRPPGVKAAKRFGKKTMKEEKGLSDFKEIWSIKEEGLTRKEKIVKMGLLDRLLAKPEPLPEYEESLKKKLISELF
ncbi:hypothetical protein F2Q69_00011670 [Brassica cretica]|uniref:Uncharacterized protein n=1 Tax=Brassica cretica TaxID=69181 RepID=A0A8S9QNV8_BRACR|nr:hypothetical protein F2Q69_00011670 [Brassica cretica]